jgi:hypothetical protein
MEVARVDFFFINSYYKQKVMPRMPSFSFVFPLIQSLEVVPPEKLWNCADTGRPTLDNYFFPSLGDVFR